VNGSVNLGALARATADVSEAQFLKNYPAPALVFLASKQEEARHLESPSAAAVASSEQEQGDDLPTFMYKLPNSKTEAHRRPFLLEGYFLLVSSEIHFLKKRLGEGDPREILVGRGLRSDIWLPLGSVSRSHAIFSRDAQGWTVRDVSLNGVALDDRRISRDVPMPLTNGMDIGLGGELRARFMLPQRLYATLDLFRRGEVSAR
jgi:hypothetical protein